MANIETCEMITFFMFVVLGQKADFNCILGFRYYLLVHNNISLIPGINFWNSKLSIYLSGLTSLTINAPHFMSYFLKLVNSTMKPSLNVCLYSVYEIYDVQDFKDT